MIFSFVHAGQVNRITYPALVPLISGFEGFFVIRIFSLMVFSYRHMKANRSGNQASAQKRFRSIGRHRFVAAFQRGSWSGGQNRLSVYLYALFAYRMMGNKPLFPAGKIH
jgi:hypothetical protein